MYELGLMGEAVDDLAELDPPVAQRILDKLHRLADNFEALTHPNRSATSGEVRSNYESAITGLCILSTIPRGESRSIWLDIGARSIRSDRGTFASL